MERQLEQGGVLNRLRFDALDPVDVEEVIFVVVGDVPFHLRRAHTSVRLRHVDHRQIEIGKDVRTHAAHRKHGGQRDRNDCDENRDRAPERGTNQPHGLSSSSRSEYRDAQTTSGRHAQSLPPVGPATLRSARSNPDIRPAPADSVCPQPRRCWPGQRHSARVPGRRSVGRPPIAPACSQQWREPPPPGPSPPAAGWSQ